MKTKRGLSAVVSAVLLILITFMAIGLIWAFIKPVVESGLEDEGSCFELRDYAKIAESELSCYNKTSGHTQLMIERGFENIEIRGFVVSILAGGDSKTYKVSIENPDNIKICIEFGFRYKICRSLNEFIAILKNV